MEGGVEGLNASNSTEHLIDVDGESYRLVGSSLAQVHDDAEEKGAQEAVLAQRHWPAHVARDPSKCR
jgi:hypothetical protein